jgi:hypothetical protein
MNENVSEDVEDDQQQVVAIVRHVMVDMVLVPLVVDEAADSAYVFLVSVDLLLLLLVPVQGFQFQVDLRKIWQMPSKIWHLFICRGHPFFREKQQNKVFIYFYNIFHCVLRLGANHFERENSQKFNCGAKFEKLG